MCKINHFLLYKLRNAQNTARGIVNFSFSIIYAYQKLGYSSITFSVIVFCGCLG